jgi:CheY-like chemotaxis protein
MNIEKIMLVDDDLMILDTYKRVLEVKGYQVSTAENGVECGINLLEFKPDLLIVDLQMPEMGGLRTIKYLMANPSYKELFVIVISGHLGQEEKDILNRARIPWLEKPVDPFLLLEEIKQLENEIPPAIASKKGA